MLAGPVPRVVQVPQLGALVAGIPLPELVAQAHHPLLGPGLLLIASAAAEDRVEAVLGDRVQQGLGLQRVAGAVGSFQQPSVIQVVLHPRHEQPDAEPLDFCVTVGQHLGEIVAGVDVQQRERHPAGPEGLRGQVQQHGGVLAAAEQQHRPFQLGDRLPNDVQRLRLQQVEVVKAAHECSPHSVLASPAQRPARGSSPGSTRRVHGWQPMDG